MAWMTKPGASGLANLASAFGKQRSSVGHLTAPGMMLHPKTMAPVQGLAAAPGATAGNGPGLGNPMAGALSGKPTSTLTSMGASVQSAAQHEAVLKAAGVSAGKRRKTF
jgi:hypothetical protein